MFKRFTAATARFLAVYGWDLVSLLGLALLSGGLSWWLHPGLGLAVFGLGLLTLGIYGSYNHGPPVENPQQPA